MTRFNYVSYGAPAAPLALAGLPLAVCLPVIYADSVAGKDWPRWRPVRVVALASLSAWRT